ncbi:gamma-glutamyl-gamma-aminobutyrate hydrolase family protein [Piscinibacter koreensis]|uniref:Gamma-glutamyl-gamma-aminobutyrate hydrolase family protein n=1 Tax=Piscinibacter koreensis TaxID=2742824 RepID=A0A7Y6TWZ6_9BURK|nr:gamma-glutamyl-gamma-aminobutyrate hydrolase family protein [Schlegelella koreensis]NUZ06590.1 gamma-glutamyl-gamma-aminobutyrate hydrolase family protein [Schlegelella koreensis]
MNVRTDPSSPRRPLRIGITARLMHEPPPELGFRNKRLQYLEQSIAHWIIRHGALAFMVPAVDAESMRVERVLPVESYVDALDGLVMQGGADVAPATYGQEPIDPRWPGDAVRDRYELALLRGFLDQRKPVIGICRGHQLLNVALGGTLHQDIGTQVPGAQAHVDSSLYDELYHEVTIVPGSTLDRLYPNERTLRVTSIHHQAIDRLGDGLVVEARSSSDGLVEAVAWTGKGYARGVQWHPEFHADKATLLASSPIMLDFLNAAAERRRKGYELFVGARERLSRLSRWVSATRSSVATAVRR